MSPSRGWGGGHAVSGPNAQTYRHGVGAHSNGLFRDGEIEFENGWVDIPVRGPFALLLGVLGVERQERLVVPVEIDGT